MAKRFGNLLSKNFRTLFTPLVRNVYRHPETFQSLEQRLAALDVSDPDVSALVDIGLPEPAKSHSTAKKQSKVDPAGKEKLMNAALTKTLSVDLDKVKEDWEKEGFLKAVHMSATHYGIFTDLYKHAFFVPQVALHIFYPYDVSHVTPVQRGNILTASEAAAIPEVSYDSSPDDLWTLVLTNLDGHLNDNDAEYLHWFVTNIKGCDVSSGEELVPYLQPFPPRGTGYHRMVFVLYKQEGGHTEFKFPKQADISTSLKERTFRTFDFYKTHQDVITPAGLAFYQVTWDSSLTSFFHNTLKMREPVYEYEQKPKSVAPQVKYPAYEPFNKYLDRYRDPKEIRQEILLKRLKMLDPFKEEPPMPKYPNLHMDPTLPSWLLASQWKENNRIGRFRDLRPHSIYEQPAFDFHKDMLEKKAGQETMT